MKEGFRQAMAWLHTWTGLIFGWLLFAIFLTGTLAYFKDEIIHWMQPEVQAHPLDDERSLAVAQNYLQQQAPTAARWTPSPSTSRWRACMSWPARCRTRMRPQAARPPGRTCASPGWKRRARCAC